VGTSGRMLVLANLMDTALAALAVCAAT